MRSPGKLDDAGYTLPELMISMGIAAAIATVLMTVSLTFFGSAIRSQVTAEMAVESHFTLRAIIEDIRLADNIAAMGVLADANAPSGGWTTSDTNNTLIINRPATTNTNDIIYDSSTGNPYDNEYIYFVSGGALYKRLIQNTAASGNSITTTCPQSATSPTCPLDRKYSSYTNDLTFTFYDTGNNVTTDTAQARSVRVGLVMSRRVFGQMVNFNNSILTNLRN